MGLTPQLSEYEGKYNHFKFRREDGILEVKMHTERLRPRLGLRPGRRVRLHARGHRPRP